jgi:hypothetical protein
VQSLAAENDGLREVINLLISQNENCWIDNPKQYNKNTLLFLCVSPCLKQEMQSLRRACVALSKENGTLEVSVELFSVKLRGWGCSIECAIASTEKEYRFNAALAHKRSDVTIGNCQFFSPCEK